MSVLQIFVLFMSFSLLISVWCRNEMENTSHTRTRRSIRSSVSTIWGTLTDLLGIIDFIEGRSEVAITKEDLEDMSQDIVSQITNRIDIATKHILTEIQLSLKLEPIYEISFAIKSVLTELGFYINVTERQKGYYASILAEPDPQLISKIRSLRQRLEDTYTNKGKTILQWIADDNRCNISAINEFHEFYITQIENAMLIETGKKKLRFENITLDVEKTFWRQEMEKVNITFAKQIKRCESDFHRLMREDMLVYDTPETLLEAISARYNWICDVFFLNDTNQKLFIEGEIEHLFRTETNGTRKSVVCARTRNGNEVISASSSFNASSVDSPIIPCIKIRYHEDSELDNLHAGNLLTASPTDAKTDGFKETTYVLNRNSSECAAHTEPFKTSSSSADVRFEILVWGTVAVLRLIF